MSRLRPSEGLFWYTVLMAKREIDLKKLVLNNYTTEEVLRFCVENLSSHMDAEKLSDKYVYWEILEALNHKVNGGKSTKVL